MTEISRLSEARLHQIRVTIALSSTTGPETDTGMLVDLLAELDRIHALRLPQAPPVAVQGFPRPFRLIVGGQQWPGAEWPDGRIALEAGEPFGLMALAGTVQELLAMQPEGSRIEWAPEFPLPIRPDGSHHYLSSGCLHEDLILPDGRTGHEYCEGETGALGTKIPATCKHCGSPCACPNHSLPTPATAPSCRWPACLSETEQQQLADDVGRAMLGEDTELMPDPRPGCGCVDRGIGDEGFAELAAAEAALPTQATRPGEPADKAATSNNAPDIAGEQP